MIQRQRVRGSFKTTWWPSTLVLCDILFLLGGCFKSWDFTIWWPGSACWKGVLCSRCGRPAATSACVWYAGLWSPHQLIYVLGRKLNKTKISSFFLMNPCDVACYLGLFSLRNRVISFWNWRTNRLILWLLIIVILSLIPEYLDLSRSCKAYPTKNLRQLIA